MRDGVSGFRFHGFMVSWFHGFRFHGFKVSWFHGFRFHGFKVSWFHGFGSLGGGLLVLGLMFAACEDPNLETRQVITQDDVAMEVAKDVEILYSDSAVVRVRVTGALLHNFSDRENARQEFPAGIRIDFLESDLSVRSTLTAKKAVRQQEKGLITARDSVVFVTVKGEKLETEELIWDEKIGKVHTDKFVKVTKPGEVIYGFGLEAEQDFSYWKILVPKGRIKVAQINELK